jgi:hypothetical protein
MLFKKTDAVYSENHMKLINTFCGQNSKLLIVKASGTYSYHGFQVSNIYQISTALKLLTQKPFSSLSDGGWKHSSNCSR